MANNSDNAANDVVEQVIEKITGNLKALYPLAQAADEQLDILKKQNKGKFTAIFQKDSVFTAHSDRFLPYMVEVAEQLASLRKLDGNSYNQQLKELLYKIQQMHQVLQQFHAIKDREPEQVN